MDDLTPGGAAAPAIELDALPGNAIRRLQQIAVASFLQEAEPHGVTPVQYAVLQALANSPGVDQRTLSRSIGFDTSTIASVVDRLEARALVARRIDPADRRVRPFQVLHHLRPPARPAGPQPRLIPGPAVGLVRRAR